MLTPHTQMLCESGKCVCVCENGEKGLNMFGSIWCLVEVLWGFIHWPHEAKTSLGLELKTLLCLYSLGSGTSAIVAWLSTSSIGALRLSLRPYRVAHPHTSGSAVELMLPIPAAWTNVWWELVYTYPSFLASGIEWPLGVCPTVNFRVYP